MNKIIITAKYGGGVKIEALQFVDTPERTKKFIIDVTEAEDVLLKHFNAHGEILPLEPRQQFNRLKLN